MLSPATGTVIMPMNLPTKVLGARKFGMLRPPKIAFTSEKPAPSASLLIYSPMQAEIKMKTTAYNIQIKYLRYQLIASSDVIEVLVESKKFVIASFMYTDMAVMKEIRTIKIK
mmetsp:Transcript_24053/g.18350  ORF Transcript_24053/g.18350 Transcript_24053/m.18350 type:complete len:113 (-) Transcript_24053:115-453(-)